MKVKYDMEEIQEYIVQHRAVMHNPIQSEMKILPSLLSDTSQVLNWFLATLIAMMQYLLLPFIHGAQKTHNFTSLHLNSVT